MRDHYAEAANAQAREVLNRVRKAGKEGYLPNGRGEFNALSALERSGLLTREIKFDHTAATYGAYRNSWRLTKSGRSVLKQGKDER